MLERLHPRQFMWNSLLFLNRTRHFLQAAHLAHLDSTNWTWAVKLADLR